MRRSLHGIAITMMELIRDRAVTMSLPTSSFRSVAALVHRTHTHTHQLNWTARTAPALHCTDAVRASTVSAFSHTCFVNISHHIPSWTQDIMPLYHLGFVEHWHVSCVYVMCPCSVLSIVSPICTYLIINNNNNINNDRCKNRVVAVYWNTEYQFYMYVIDSRLHRCEPDGSSAIFWIGRQMGANEQSDLFPIAQGTLLVAPILRQNRWNCPTLPLFFVLAKSGIPKRIGISQRRWAC